MVPNTIAQVRAQKPVLIDTQQETPKNPSTGDSQLDRLLAVGWEIDSQDQTKVNLFKIKSGVRKTMVHCRPKKNRK
jgi:hypothetical protein